LIKFGINGNENDVLRRFDPIDDAVSGTLAFLYIAVLYSGLINRINDLFNLISNNLSGLNVIDERLDIRSNGAILSGKGPQVAFELRGVFDLDNCTGFTRH